MFGTDYPTEDGSCVRDFIHVSDLTGAHVKALERLIEAPDENLVLNLGYGRGLSVLEVLDALDRLLPQPIRREMKGRRAGDPPLLISSNRAPDGDARLDAALRRHRHHPRPCARMGAQAADAELGVKLLRLPLLALAALQIGAAPPQPINDAHAAERIRAHVEFLASDLLEGRDTGSRGHRIAANYVAAEFRKLGLKPGGTNGSWMVEVPFRRATLAEPPIMSMTLNGRTTKLIVGKDAAVRPSITERDLRISAPLVFIGHGVRDARLGLDDYAGLDVRGKIVVVLADPSPGVPSDAAAPRRPQPTHGRR